MNLYKYIHNIDEIYVHIYVCMYVCMYIYIHTHVYNGNGITFLLLHDFLGRFRH
jgi:hypothetical protein